MSQNVAACSQEHTNYDCLVYMRVFAGIMARNQTHQSAKHDSKKQQPCKTSTAADHLSQLWLLQSCTCHASKPDLSVQNQQKHSCKAAELQMICLVMCQTTRQTHPTCDHSEQEKSAVGLSFRIWKVQTVQPQMKQQGIKISTGIMPRMTLYEVCTACIHTLLTGHCCQKSKRW